jgi:hypothetical protein
LDGESALRKAATYTQNDINADRYPRHERDSTVHESDRAVTVIGKPVTQLVKKIRYFHETGRFITEFTYSHNQ